MFGLGMLEIAVIAGLALLLFPPHELPKLARMIARAYGQLRRTAEEFRGAVLHDEDLRKPFDDVKSAYHDARWSVRRAQQQAREELARARMEARLAARAQAREESDDEAGGEAGSEGESVSPRAPTIAVGDLDDAPTEPVHVEAADGFDESQAAPPAAPPAPKTPPPIAGGARVARLPRPPAVGTSESDDEGVA